MRKNSIIRLKRICLSLLCLLLALCAISCSEYSQAPGGKDHTTGNSGSSNKPSVDTEAPFTVKIRYDGKTYIPEQTLYAHWSDGYSIHNAEFDSEGVASVSGLDGDYKVTLSQIPEGYSYNPNIYVATNDRRDVVIDIYKITETKGKGSSPYSCIEIDKTGMYQAIIEDADDTVYYQFTPRASGVYGVVGWVDTSANNINPMIDVYNGSSQFKVYAYTLDDGGESAQYTKNFKYEVKISSDGIGQAFTFGIKGFSKDNKYPIAVNFAVQLDGAFNRNYTVSKLILPQEQFKQTPEYNPALYTFVGAETLDRGHYIFDGSMYGLNEEDGYYHLYNESTGKYDGPILYAHVSSACRFLSLPFTQIEYQGNKALTVSNATENYKLFIEGFDALVRNKYFCGGDCVGCHNEGEICYLSGQVCTVSSGCTKCTVNCNYCPDEAVGVKGYADYTNSDGVYAVTPELKDFLQKYSVSQLLFFDGNGYVEENPTIKVDAKEEDQWLFACGYYVAK